MGILVQSISNCLEDTYSIDEGRVIKRICRAKEIECIGEGENLKENGRKELKNLSTRRD